MLAKIKAWIGNLWGKATTQILAIGLVLQAALADPTVAGLIASVPWLPRVIGILALSIAVLRQLAPPPPSVAIQEGGKATLIDDKTIAITTTAPLTSAVVQAAAAQPDVEPMS